MGRGCAQRWLLCKVEVQSTPRTWNCVTLEVSWRLCFSSLGDLCSEPTQGESASSGQKRFSSHLPDKSSLCKEEPSSHRLNALTCQREQWWETPTESLCPQYIDSRVHKAQMPRAQFKSGPARTQEDPQATRTMRWPHCLGPYLVLQGKPSMYKQVFTLHLIFTTGYVFNSFW